MILLLLYLVSAVGLLHARAKFKLNIYGKLVLFACVDETEYFTVPNPTSNQRASLGSSCSKTNSSDVTVCLEPMIQLSEVISNKVPLVNQILFPLYHFHESDIEQICQIWAMLHGTCLTPTLSEQCSTHALLQILKSLFAYSCADASAHQFFTHFGCIKSVIANSPRCLSFIMVPEKAKNRPRTKCGSIPDFYDCVKRELGGKCGAAALDTFESTMAGFGCPVGDVKDRDIGRSPTTTIAPFEKLRQTTETIVVLPESQSFDTASQEVFRKFTESVQTQRSRITPSPLTDDVTDRNIQLVNTLQLEEHRPSLSQRSAESQRVGPPISRARSVTATKIHSGRRLRQPKLSSDESKFIAISPSAELSLEPTGSRSSEAQVRQPKPLSEDATRESRQIADIDDNLISDVPYSNKNDVSRNTASSSSISPFTAHHSNCSRNIRQRTRDCLAPVMSLWKRYSARDPALGKTAFPLFLMDRSQVLDACDAYASAFLDCDLSEFLACAPDDAVVGFADATFGYACGNAIPFFRAFDCLSVVAKDSGTAVCRQAMTTNSTSGGSHGTGASAAPVDFETRCRGIGRFYECVSETVEAICPVKSMDVLKESIEYYGCTL